MSRVCRTFNTKVISVIDNAFLRKWNSGYAFTLCAYAYTLRNVIRIRTCTCRGDTVLDIDRGALARVGSVAVVRSQRN